MCVGKCTRIVGPCLLVLSVLSIAANVLLLFPGWAWKYLAEGRITKEAKAMPGIWGGITVSGCCQHQRTASVPGEPGTHQPFVAQAKMPWPLPAQALVMGLTFNIQVLVAATHITAVGWRCACCSDCGTRRNVFLSIVLSMLALLGSAASFIMSGVGLTNGPLCLYNTSDNELDHGPRWGYPFVDPNSQTFDSRISIQTENYLNNWSLWSTCLEPMGIVTWNVCFFSILLLVSASEMVLASLQIINGCFGSLCGFCDGK